MNRARAVASSSLAITDPLVKYQTLLATGRYAPDAAQHRLAIHLQKLYVRLKDYTPAAEYQARLRQVTRAIASAKQSVTDELAAESHPIRGNPLFARFFQKTEGRDSLSLTRVLTSHQAALQIDSPRGLFLSGEVGTGKSMLLDLLAEGLPTSGKKRWHFNTFMLYAFQRLENYRMSSSSYLSTVDQEYSLLWLAKDIVEDSPILFLDEFQLPDRAASKILNNLFIAFFQLGGVLVASSNRMPDDLEKAIGSRFSPPTTGGLVKQFLGIGRQNRGELFGQSSDFAAFMEVLKARCDFWHMEGDRDFRRLSTQLGLKEVPSIPSEQAESSSAYSNYSAGFPQDSAEVSATTDRLALKKGDKVPTMYFVSTESDEAWRNAASPCSEDASFNSTAWQPAKLVVYGRILAVPKQYNQTTYWEFADLVQSFGPADYITLASNYSTFIIDRIPVLQLSMKNEARRFITLLDALYEARCKLIVRADAGPDGLFFPETRQPQNFDAKLTDTGPEEGEDATYSETLAEVFQDQMAPFRPNISTYSNSPNAKYNPDQDSDFGTDQHKDINFSNTGAFTGEDERFAYKRATSRLWELCSAQWHARTGDWWQPLPAEARHWEGREPSKPLSQHVLLPSKSEISSGPSTMLDEPAGLERFRLAALQKEHE